MNTHWEALPFELPRLPDGLAWHVAVNTAAPEGEDSWDIDKEPLLGDQGSFLMGSRSVAILIGR
jgi:glycogen operon protein